MSDPEPMAFPQGVGRMIPGFDYGLAGMHVGGKRRLFIPYQMAYGSRDIPDRGADHPGIPGKSDLIFDVELVSVTDMPAPPQRPMPAPGAPGAPGQPPTPPPAGAASAPAPPSSAPKVQATTPAPDAKPAPQPQSPDKN
jgi:peptidylprolyl isomerase